MTSGTQNNKESVSLGSTDEKRFAAEISKALADWKPSARTAELAKWSLESVTHLTEYEDEKANRIFTAVAFLSALVGGLFAVVATSFPIAKRITLWNSGNHLGWTLLVAMYGLFAIYFALVVLGAVATLCGIRPRFKVPSNWKPTDTKPSSMLFFEKVYEVQPEDWGKAFSGTNEDQLQTIYARNCVFESYLIAHKIREKLVWLRPGAWLFIASTIVLLALIATIVAAVASGI